MVLTDAIWDRVRSAAKEHAGQVAQMGMQICSVAAPTGDEGRRGQFVASLLRDRGYTPEIDEIGNVYTRRGDQRQRPVLMVLAHLDTVFPIETPLRVERDGAILRGPGIGDNSISVAGMLGLIDVLDQLDIQTAADIVAVANVGEEGLGNLRGARAAVERYKDRLGAVIAIDGNIGGIVAEAVGSKRWRISVHGPGGHSYSSFGRPSAIHGLARLVTRIAEIRPPQQPRTTYNVGVIEGGTSVNTIAASATALLDMRSVDVRMLDRLTDQVKAIIDKGVGEGLECGIEVLGERPAGRIEKSHPLIKAADQVLRWSGKEPQYASSSTDINIPLSLGIPAVCVGLTEVHRAHTIEEWLETPPIEHGLAQIVRLCIEAAKLM